MTAAPDNLRAPGVDPRLAACLAAAPQPVYLVWGDRVLAEPLAERLGQALAERVGGELQVLRRPTTLAPLLADLRTFALFGGAKVVVVIESDLLADRAAAEGLLREVADHAGGPLAEPLDGRDREAALRLLRVVRLYGADPRSGDEGQLIAALPEAALRTPREGSRRRAAAAADVRPWLVELLAAARRDGLEGWGDSDATELADVLQAGLPAGHALILAESSVAAEHPVRRQLEARGAILAAGELALARGAFSGLEQLAAELARETGVRIARRALDELARRTLRSAARSAEIDPDTTARFAGEYRKLAALSAGREIDEAMVAEAVEDRGQEDVWKILDALVDGQPEQALSRLDRLIEGSEDAEAARLSFFGLVATFCRHLTALSGRARAVGVPLAEASYNRFKERCAAALQAKEPDLAANPLSGLHPFRLHRAYLLASRLPAGKLDRLPWRLLETERRLKGESAETTTALAELLLELAAPRGRR